MLHLALLTVVECRLEHITHIVSRSHWASLFVAGCWIAISCYLLLLLLAGLSLTMAAAECTRSGLTTKMSCSRLSVSCSACAVLPSVIYLYIVCLVHMFLGTCTVCGVAGGGACARFLGLMMYFLKFE
jgi:hypothetical protein